MRCTSPRTVGFNNDGKTLCWSQKHFSKEFATFLLPCGKCIQCRLEQARDKAVRCVHEASMYSRNSFITLTYDDDHIGDNRLDYRDWQLFMKKLRKTQNDPIGMFVTGEYGTISKRKHWHALLFNYRPSDGSPSRRTELGHQCYTSANLTSLWNKGRVEFGDVTFESAGYTARYAAKKLVHGHDNQHDYSPISRSSSKHAIGKRWLEKFWPDVFNEGRIILPGGIPVPIPRYYERWLKDNLPQEWERYVTGVKLARITAGINKQTTEEEAFKETVHRRRDLGKTFPKTRRQVEKILGEERFKLLQSHLKLK